MATLLHWLHNLTVTTYSGLAAYSCYQHSETECRYTSLSTMFYLPHTKFVTTSRYLCKWQRYRILQFSVYFFSMSNFFRTLFTILLKTLFPVSSSVHYIILLVFVPSQHDPPTTLSLPLATFLKMHHTTRHCTPFLINKTFYAATTDPSVHNLSSSSASTQIMLQPNKRNNVKRWEDARDNGETHTGVTSAGGCSKLTVFVTSATIYKRKTTNETGCNWLVGRNMDLLLGKPTCSSTTEINNSCQWFQTIHPITKLYSLNDAKKHHLKQTNQQISICKWWYLVRHQRCSARNRHRSGATKQRCSDRLYLCKKITVNLRSMPTWARSAKWRRFRRRHLLRQLMLK